MAIAPIFAGAECPACDRIDGNPCSDSPSSHIPNGISLATRPGTMEFVVSYLFGRPVAA